jgi:hypothetical protein
MKTKILTTAVLLTLGLATQAQADDIPCDTLQGLSAATGYLSFTNQKDLLGLQGKVAEAMDKTAEGKTCDATQKLRDYESKLSNLLGATKPKVEEVHPGTLACIATALDLFIDESCEPAGDPPRGKGPKK